MPKLLWREPVTTTVIRSGEPAQPRGSTLLQPGDELLVLSDQDDEPKLVHLFEGRR